MVYASKHYPGLRADIFIFRHKLQTRLPMTRKLFDDSEIDDGENDGDLDGSWGFLFDEGYISIQREIRSFIPKKK